MRLGFIVSDRPEPWDSVHQGIGYVAAFARQELPDAEIAVFRTHGRSDEDLLAFLSRGWDLLGITLTAITASETARICELAKGLPRPPAIVLGGAHATSEEKNVFQQVPLADFAVIGEGEHTFVELVRALRGERALADVTGLAWKQQDGTIVQNPPRPWEQDLERFPPPDRRLFEYDYNFHSIIGTRGCPFACTFCNSSANWGRRYRVRSPKAIADEIRAVQALYGNDKYFAFNDDIFNVKKQWVLDVCDEIRRTGARWWIRGLKAELVDEEMVDAFASSNCIGGACGVESADNTVLKSIQKGTTIERLMNGVELLYSRNLCLIGQFMIGNLGDTLETVRRSIAVAARFKESTFGIAYPIPHTTLYDYVKKYGLFLDPPVPIEHQGRVIDWILFATPEFSVEDRLQAVREALTARVYHNVDYAASVETGEHVGRLV
jgi:radical SAM superfamily enzyme YgiQ (UPF0313 family)